LSLFSVAQSGIFERLNATFDKTATQKEEAMYEKQISLMFVSYENERN